MCIVISIVTTEKMMQNRILKNVTNISRWNLKTCSSNAGEGKKKEIVELDTRGNKQNNEMADLSSDA